ncbi:hypothetical protein RR48_00099 [Papilio machaon]|uniref:Uncharacterized protein n=1 Tax=Papilio machaon TaxID=76193 RepID=A0A0N0PF65_PAPMA|nr:hypothetical protein RR48_00099 [Papilio machaon]
MTNIKVQKDNLCGAYINIYNLQIQIFSLALAVCSVLLHRRRRSRAGGPFRPHPPPRAPSHRALQLRFSTPRVDILIIFAIYFVPTFLLQVIISKPVFHSSTYSPHAQHYLS